MCVDNAAIDDLQEALASGRTSSTALVRAYLARIEAYDRGGTRLNAVRETNSDALAISAALDYTIKLWELTSGEGVFESSFAGYEPVADRPPTRRRTTVSPLSREEYLASLGRRSR